MGTEAKLWALETLRSARADPSGAIEVDPKNPVVFTIPAFQRSLVWPEPKQRSLIASILKGFPFGALLLVEYDQKKTVTLASGKTVSATNYGIIDGLQRTNAIVEHLRLSLVFATADAASGPAFDDLHAELQTQLSETFDPQKLMDAVVIWMHATKSPDITTGFDFDTLLTTIAIQLGVSPLSTTAVSALKPRANALLQAVAKAVDIGSLQIPVLVYNGPKEHLPDIFEQINTAGTMLSKYEVYAAAWVSTSVTVGRAEVKAAIARRYKVLEDEGFSVDISHAGNDYSLFDYLHGLSQYLGERYPNLFSKKDAARNKLSGAFPLATLMLGQPLSGMSALDTLFPTSAGKLDVDAFEQALFDAADVVDSILTPFLAFKFTSDSEALAHGELQMVSIVAAVAAHLFDHANSFKPRGSAAKRAKAKKALAKAIPQHYIYDILRQQWRGSLYTYAAERVWDGVAPSPTYTVPVDPASFDSALATSLVEQLADVSHKRQNITAADRVFLKFLYSPVVSVQDQSAHKFDVEHWIPVKRIVDMVGTGSPWPMGAMGNLGVLPMAPNRIKQDETVTEYLGRTKNAPPPAVAALVRKMVLVPVSRVAIPQSSAGDAMTSAQFESFVRANWTAMGKLLKKNVGL